MASIVNSLGEGFSLERNIFITQSASSLESQAFGDPLREGRRENARNDLRPMAIVAHRLRYALETVAIVQLPGQLHGILAERPSDPGALVFGPGGQEDDVEHARHVIVLQQIDGHFEVDEFARVFVLADHQLVGNV